MYIEELSRIIRNIINSRVTLGQELCPQVKRKMLLSFAIIVLSIAPYVSKGENCIDVAGCPDTGMEAIPQNVLSTVEDDYVPINYEGREDIAWCGDMAAQISHKGKKLIITLLDEKGKPMNTQYKMFKGSIIETVCYDNVYVVMNMLEEGDVSKIPFVGLYKVDLLNDTCELLDTANYIEFDRNAGKVKLKTATGPAGECEADGFVWKEKTIEL